MESVAAGMIGGWNCHRRVFALPSSSCSSPRQVVSLVNIPSDHNNFVQFSLRSSTVVPSRPITVVASSKQFFSSYNFSYSTSLEEDYNYNNKNNANQAKKLFKMMKKVSAARNSPICRTLSKILANLLSYGLLFAFTITVHTLFARNSALAVSYDRIGGSSSLLSSLLSSSSSASLSSTSYSSSCNCEKTSPSIHINIVFPYAFQLCASLTVTLLANLYSMLQPLLDQLIMSKRHGSVFFFQVAVSDKEQAFRRKLNKIAENADTSTLNGLNNLLKEVVKALLQYNDSSIHFTYLNKIYAPMTGLRKRFEEFIDRELQRHGEDENTLVNANDNFDYINKTSMVKADSSSENVYTVVTVLVLATGEHLIPYSKEKGRTCHDSFEVFQTLQRIPKNEIQSVEVMWSPRKDNEVLLEDQLLREFPRLIRIEKGILYM